MRGRRRSSDLVPARHALEREIERIDLACSRFRPDSDIARVHRAGGRWTHVGEALFEAVSVAVDAARVTDGLVDPTVGAAIVALGYDRDFATLSHAPDEGVTVVPAPVCGWRAIELDPEGVSVRVPPGTVLDLGATAKALAVDRAGSAAARWCRDGVLVGIGGDLALAGPPPPEGWPVRIADRHDDRGCERGAGPAPCVALHDGGLATSSTAVRRWTRGKHTCHHIVDPITGLPTSGRWRTASVAAATCVQANVASTAAIVLGDGAAQWLAEMGLRGATGRQRRQRGAGGALAGAARAPRSGVTATSLLAEASGRQLWYLTRSTGIVALVLLSATVVLGIAAGGDWARPRWPRFVTQALHRNLSLLAVVLVFVHVLTTVVDGYVPVGWLDAFVPFHSPYHRALLGLGAIAFDLLLAVLVSSMVRRHLSHRVWRAVHLLAYGAWPIALVHGLGTGTDTSTLVMRWTAAACILATGVAVTWRATRRSLHRTPLAPSPSWPSACSARTPRSPTRSPRCRISPELHTWHRRLRRRSPAPTWPRLRARHEEGRRRSRGGGEWRRIGTPGHT